MSLAAELRLGASQGSNHSKKVVDDILKRLGLTASADTVVGDAKTRGLSGGEKKRLSIACELIGSPLLLFADEPTTGLDSFQAEKVGRASPSWMHLHVSLDAKRDCDCTSRFVLMR